MVSRYTIEDATAEHVALIHAKLREGDALEAAMLGFEPRRGIWKSYRRSLIRKTAWVDGEIAAMWGLAGCLFGTAAEPWLVTTPAVEKIPLSFVRVGRDELAGMLDICPRLENQVLTSYRQAVRFLEVLGFTLGEPRPYGPHGALFQTFTLER